MSDREGSIWSGLLALWKSPVAALWLGIACTLDACSLPRSTVVGSMTNARRGTHCRFDCVNVTIWQDRGKLILSGENGDLPAKPGPSAVEAGLLFFAPARPYDEGFWSATRRCWRYSLHINAPSLTGVEISEVRDLFADYLGGCGQGGLPWQAAMVRSGAGPSPQVLWSGYVHNGISLVLFAGLVFSLASARSWPAMVEGREQRWARAVAAGLCPNCRYDTRGLVEKRCPECGTGW